MIEGVLLFLAIAVWTMLSGRKARAEEAERRRIAAITERYGRSLDGWISRWSAELDPDRWIPKGSFDELLEERPPPALPDEMARNRESAVREREKKAQEAFTRHNEALLRRKKQTLKGFFDTIERNPLTEEQVDACICMDEHVQIVASAGSGKTSTMVAKVGYVLHEDLADPEEIIALAFNRDAAEELGERVSERLTGLDGAARVRTTTFHAFGLEVIGEATRRKPHIAPWLENNEEARYIEEMAAELGIDDPDFAYRWDYFRAIYGRDIARAGCDRQIDDGHGAGKQPRYHAASGDLVRSKEELAIANWLFFHGIEFRYEHSYEIDTADERHAAYRPDFFYPGISLYHEHFALDRHGNSPFGQQYVDGVVWKRKLHERHGTRLFETCSHEMIHGGHLVTGPALDRLRDELVRHGLEPRLDPDRETKNGLPPITSNDLARLIRTFQQHVKSNGMTMDDVRAAARRSTEDDRPKGFLSSLFQDMSPSTSGSDRIDSFLAIYERISGEWDRRLRQGNHVDFEDMLLLAAECIEDGRYRSPYRIILADEFQDSSRARIRLLQALARAHDDTHLCVVGDDWQGINRFAGADITVMTEFERSFDPATTLTLSRTFRCPKQICEVSSSFIQKNPAQLTKRVIPNGDYDNAVVAFASKDDGRLIAHLERRLERMQIQIDAGSIPPSRDGKVSVLILGRYNSLRPLALAQWQKRFERTMTIEYRTIHRSKGLEADYVITLGMDAGKRGFPSAIQDDPLLQIPMPAPDPYEHAEERRLFYVALTRARRQTWLYASATRPSDFVLELAREDLVSITSLDGEEVVPCPTCGKGVLQARDGKYGAFLGCSAYPECTHTAKIAPASMPATTVAF